MTPSFLILSTAFAAVYTYYLFQFLQNLRAARATRLPYLIRPVHELNHLFALLEPVVVAFLDHLPEKLSRWLYFYTTARDWRFRLKHTLHQQYGDTFLIVSPTFLSVEIADPELQLELGNRRNDLIRPTWMFEPVNYFGPSIVSAGEQDWRRHRKILPPHFTNIYAFVWERGVATAQSMFALWKEQDLALEQERRPSDSRINFLSDINANGLRVNISSIFGVQLPFKPFEADDETPKREKATNLLGKGVTESAVETYTDAIHTTLERFITVLAIPRSILQRGTPGMRKIAQDSNFVHEFLHGVVATEQKHNSEKGPQSLLRRLVLNGMQDNDSRGAVLSEEEVVGNLFMLTLAGSGSTSDSIAHTIALLAIHQNVQDWVYEEIAENSFKDIGPEGIAGGFSRTLAAFYETLRLLPTQLALASWNPGKPQTVRIDGRTCVFPARTLFNVNLPGLHYNPKHWGEDAFDFRPQRWTLDKSQTPQAPVQGAFASFSRGSHSCLGRKFAETIAVATIGTLLKTHRVTLEVRDGKSLETARRDAWESLRWARSHFTLTMKRDVGLKFIPR